MNYVKNILLAIIAATVIPGLASNRVFVPVKNSGTDIDVRTIPILKEKLYVDTIGFGSETPNWGGPFVIGHCNGHDIAVGYDYNYLTHIVFVDGKPVLHDGALMVDADSVANRAVFQRADKSIDIDFNKPDAIARLASFIEPPKGWTRQSYTYDFGDGLNTGFINRTTYVADIPSDSIRMRHYLKAITSQLPYGEKLHIIDDDYLWADTVRYAEPRPETNTLYDLVRADALFNHINSDSYHLPMPADTMAPPMSGTARLVEYIPAIYTDTLMTINTVMNQTYPAGGCRNSQETYTTFVTRGDSVVRLSEDEIFLPEKIDLVKRIFIEHMLTDLADAKEPITRPDEEFNICSLYVSYVNNDRIFSEESYRHGFDSPYEFAQYNIDKGDYSYIQIPEVALVNGGIALTYDLSCYSDFGEDGLTLLFIPYKVIKDCLRPEYRSFVK